MKRLPVLFTLVLGITGCTDNSTTDMTIAPDMTFLPDISVPKVMVGGSIVSYSMQTTPLAGVKVCVYPSTTDCVTTVADGKYSLMVAATGQVGISFSKDQFLSAMQEITSPVTGPVNFILIESGTALLLALSVGASIDDTKGIIVVGAGDAAGKGLAGVTFAATPSAGMGPYYFGALGPDPAATSTAADGRGIWVNSTPGDFAITATLTGKTCAPAPPAAWVGANQVTAKATAIANTLTALAFACQ